MAPPELPRNVIYIISAIDGSIGDDKERGNCGLHVHQQDRHRVKRGRLP